MTSKLKCPVCKKPLEQVGTSRQYQCGSWGCDASFDMIGTESLWAAWIQAKQDLEIAKSYVKGVSQMVINSGDNIYIVIGHFKKLAEQTLKQIEHKE